MNEVNRALLWLMHYNLYKKYNAKFEIDRAL